jgi:hypothetical protein
VRAWGEAFACPPAQHRCATSSPLIPSPPRPQWPPLPQWQAQLPGGLELASVEEVLVWKADGSNGEKMGQ